LPSRLKKSLKKRIAKLDRELQFLGADLERCKTVLSMWQPGSSAAKYWGKHQAKQIAAFQKLDARRKAARLKLKGYSVE